MSGMTFALPFTTCQLIIILKIIIFVRGQYLHCKYFSGKLNKSELMYINILSLCSV